MANLSFLILIFSAGVCSVRAEDSEATAAAIRECSNLHRLDFRTLPNARGEYSNGHCSLKCSVGERVLSNETLNEGYPCPADSNGICRQGQCQQLDSTLDAQRECGNLHHIDFHPDHHSIGTTYLANQCLLRCVISGAIISESAINEGYPCPSDTTKSCHSGQCVSSTTSVDQTDQPPPTVTTPRPDLPPWNVYELRQLTIVIHNSTLVNTYDSFTVGGCLQTYAWPEKAPDGCRQTCASPQLKVRTNHPSFEHRCNLQMPFNANDHVTLRVFEHSLQHFETYTEVGNAVLHIRDYIRAHLHNQTDHTEASWSFSLNETLPIYKWEPLPVQITGNIAIELDAVLGHK